MDRRFKTENLRIKNQIEKIDNISMEIITLIGINKIVPQENYKEKLRDLGIKLCEEASKYGYCCTQHGTLRNKQFEKYKWHLENISVYEVTLIKIMSDVFKMIDKDEYFYKNCIDEE